MYKNFNLTDEERKHIMEQHSSYGYRKPLNKQTSPVNEATDEEVNQYNQKIKNSHMVLDYIGKLFNDDQISREVALDFNKALNDVLNRYHDEINGRESDSQIQPEEGFKVGDTVSDPVNLNDSPDHDGKILEIFPNLNAAEGKPGYESMLDWMKRFPENAEGHNVNGKWYLIEWRTEGIGLYSEKDMLDVIIAPDGRNYDDYEEDENRDDARNWGNRYKWDWKDRNG